MGLWRKFRRQTSTNILGIAGFRHNEAYNLSQRYLKFNLQELVRVAVKAKSEDGARRCVEVLKCKEGMNNKAFLLTMDNGSVVFAKLPNACAGPAFYTTASEVATRTFLREILDIPTPRIIAWSSEKSNPVGAEYILEEKAQGQPLWALWQDWNRLSIISRFGIIRQIVEFERRLTDTAFKQCGCIYFKADAPYGEQLATTRTAAPSSLEQFRMGPLVTMDYWQKEKATMDMNRGPFHGAVDFIENKAISEKMFLEQHGHSRLNYARSRVEPEMPEEMLDLLDTHLKLTPAMVPPPTTEDIDAFTLWHSDLHLDNIFVDPNTLQITSVIDWQSTAATSFFCHCEVPKMVRHREPVSLDLSDLPKRRDCAKDASQNEIDFAEKMHRSEHLHQYYLQITRRDNSRHWAALKLDDEIQVQPVKIVQQLWESNTMFFLRRALMRIVTNWERLCPDSGPCPVSFSDENISLFNREVEKRGFVSDTLNLIQNNYGLNPDGTVVPSKYNEMQAELNRLKAVCLEAAETDEERIDVEKLWPFQDTVDGESLAT
ncbi:Protein kinase-like (PK-like) [Glarea lozoyensis ATCC 20868]|uniref:Protein kinase-like (PK-like) n=1 Tax=Glarea lozoyensis (strain ATCC 20868 / MF5171) TaxID=1116229 RepID=S3D4U5_GLAL2|nr:Protein kinase-like (PK-like) [Glarea lozoyensis ATCC 20868]EPE32785.1 Protein kinase-like (PK-like) [Glarea lozoyensis ATCC 20868]